MNDFSVRSVCPDDFENIRALCDERYGEGYFTREDFERFSERPELFTAAENDGDFAGFALMVPASEEKVSEQMKIPANEVHKLANGKPLLIYKSLALRKQYEKMGLPYTMSKLLLTEAKKQGYGTLFASAWVYNGKMPIEKLFKAFGFIPLGIRNNLWYNETNYRCTVCGGRCRCDAMIFYKSLEEWEE